jgi:hypothetical protein
MWGHLSSGAGQVGDWWGDYLSSSHDKVSTGVVLATIGFFVGVTTYIYWGLIWRAEIPPNLATLTNTLIYGGIAGLGITELPRLRG